MRESPSRSLPSRLIRKRHNLDRIRTSRQLPFEAQVPSSPDKCPACQGEPQRRRVPEETHHADSLPKPAWQYHPVECHTVAKHTLLTDRGHTTHRLSAPGNLV